MPSKPRILVVDDDYWGRRFLKEILLQAEYEVEDAADGTEAIQKIRRQAYDLIITDFKMKELSGLDVLIKAKEQKYDPEILLTTAYGTIESAVEAIKLGAFDYLTKPIDSKRILITIEQALERKRLRGEVLELRKQVAEKFGYKNIVTVSPKMQKVLELGEVISKTDSTVLIQGESGTGKELIARAIHFGGLRADKPFIAVNCAALPEPLLESELFGHVKGAFTGAVRDKKGLFEESNEGTLLLDEVGDMPQSIQVKLLRVLQENKVRRVGSNVATSVDVRIIASTNRELIGLVKENKFREDLFYRLNVIPITIPPLRERKEDIGPLANHFMKVFSKKFKKKVQGFTPEAIKLLMSYEWSGNVRELENFVERIVALVPSETITASDITNVLQLDKQTETENRELKGLNLLGAYQEVEKEYIIKSLEKNNWNQIRAAEELGISRSSLWRKIKKYSITIPA